MDPIISFLRIREAIGGAGNWAGAMMFLGLLFLI